MTPESTRAEVRRMGLIVSTCQALGLAGGLHVNDLTAQIDLY